MISTTKRRIVFVGEYNDWTSKWMCFDDESNSNLTRKEFGSYKSDVHKEKDGIFSRFVDSSDFVVRFSKFRTLSGSGKYKFTYGKKTDAIVVEGRPLSENTNSYIYEKKFKGSDVERSISKYGTNHFHLGHEDENFMLELFKGIIPINSYSNPELYSYKNGENLGLSKMNSQTKGLYDRLSGRAIASVYNPEVWFPLGRVFTECSELMFNRICGMKTPTFLKNNIKEVNRNEISLKLKNLSNTVRLAKDKYSEHMGLNGKCLSTVEYLQLRDLIDQHYESFGEMNDKFYGNSWWSDMINKRVNKLEEYADHHSRYVEKNPDELLPVNNFSYEDAFEISRSAININRGTEALWMAMNDSRFDDYDFYMIGYYGLDQQFITPYLGDYLTEYKLLTDWVKNRKVKYLPEHINEANSEFESILKKDKYPIFK